MADIASLSREATSILVYDLHHIDISVLHHIEEEYRIADYDQEASSSHGPSIRPPVLSTTVVCNPFEVEREGELIGEVVVKMVREVVVHLIRHCLLPYPFPPPPHTYPSPDTSKLPHTYSSPDSFIPPQTYTSPSIPQHTCTSLPSPVSSEPASMVVDITLSSHPLSSPTLPPIDETMVNLVLELGALPARRPRAPRVHRVLHPSSLLAPSTLVEISQDPIDQLVVYYRRHPKRNIKTPSCGTQ